MKSITLHLSPAHRRAIKSAAKLARHLYPAFSDPPVAVQAVGICAHLLVSADGRAMLNLQLPVKGGERSPEIIVGARSLAELAGPSVVISEDGNDVVVSANGVQRSAKPAVTPSSFNGTAGQARATVELLGDPAGAVSWVSRAIGSKEQVALRPMLGCIRLVRSSESEIIAEATDSYRLHETRIAIETEYPTRFDNIVDATAFRLVLEIAETMGRPISMVSSEEAVQIRAPGMTATIACEFGTWPPTDEVWPAFESCGHVRAARLEKRIRQLVRPIPPSRRSIRLELRREGSSMHALDKFDQVATAGISDVLSWNRDDLDLEFDPAFLCDALAANEEAEIHATEPDKPIVVMAGARKALVMPRYERRR